MICQKSPLSSGRNLFFTINFLPFFHMLHRPVNTVQKSSFRLTIHRVPVHPDYPDSVPWLSLNITVLSSDPLYLLPDLSGHQMSLHCFQSEGHNHSEKNYTSGFIHLPDAKHLLQTQHGYHQDTSVILYEIFPFRQS